MPDSKRQRRCNGSKFPSLCLRLFCFAHKKVDAERYDFKNYGYSRKYSNVQNEQFPRRHFYVPFGEFVHLHMQYCSFANSILKHSAFQFFTPAGKPTVNFNLDVLKKRNKKVDTHHIRKYNKHKQNQYIKSYLIFYAVRQENPNIKDLHEAAINSSNSVLAASCQKQKKRSEAYGAKRYYRKGIGRL